MPGADTLAGAAAAARSRVLAAPRVPHMPLYLRGLLFCRLRADRQVWSCTAPHISLKDGRGKAPQLHKASLLHLDVDRSNGCRTRGECWAAAGCVERTERVQLQRPPSICMLMHARARTKTRGNPDRGTRVPATKSCGLPRWQCVCIAVGAAAQVRMRATARCKYKIVSDISCDSAHVQQQHDTS